MVWDGWRQYHRRMIRAALVLFLALPVLKAEVYCFGFLNSHPERKEIPQAEAEAIQKGHMAHMEQKGLEGRLLAAGPMATQGGPRGIVLYRCKSVEEADGWTALDPAVVNKRLTTEFYRWRGPDGFGEPLMTMLKADPKAKYQMVRLPLIVFKKTEKWEGTGPAEVLKEHGASINVLRQAGKLRAAGPFVDGEGRFGLHPVMLGLYVMSAMPLEEAKAIAEQDPMVRGGYARVETHIWFVADEVVPKPASAGSDAPR